jgi:hypothetical protein
MLFPPRYGSPDIQLFEAHKIPILLKDSTGIKKRHCTKVQCAQIKMYLLGSFVSIASLMHSARFFTPSLP